MSFLCIFGCCVYALPSHKRDAKVDVYACSGIFLGYKCSLCHASYLDVDTNKIKVARHIAFDESMRNLVDPPPFAQLLCGDLPPKPLHLDDALINMRINTSPFNNMEDMEDFQCELCPDTPHRLGLQMESCPCYRRAYVSAFNCPFGTYSRNTTNPRLMGSYIIRIGDIYTFSPANVKHALESLCARDLPPSTVTIRLAIDNALLFLVPPSTFVPLTSVALLRSILLQGRVQLVNNVLASVNSPAVPFQTVPMQS